jgi:cob(I)alamin adenosyltransferase
MKIPDLIEDDISFLENDIDMMMDKLPPMKFFILPGGHATVSTLHIARCVCRRTERLCVHMQAENLYVDPLVIKYLNRLSDHLFALARYVAHLLQVPEIPWIPRVKK